MKSKIVTTTIALLLVSFSTFAFSKHGPISTREVNIESKYQKIKVAPNIKLLLVAGNNSNSVTIAGNQNRLDDITVKVANNELIISSQKSINYGSVTVYVPAKNVSYIELKNGASVSGEGYLQFDDLTVFLNVDSKVELKVVGNITIKKAEDCEVFYEKNETGKIAYVKQ